MGWNKSYTLIYLSMLGLTLDHISERGPNQSTNHELNIVAKRRYAFDHSTVNWAHNNKTHSAIYDFVSFCYVANNTEHLHKLRITYTSAGEGWISTIGIISWLKDNLKCKYIPVFLNVFQWITSLYSPALYSVWPHHHELNPKAIKSTQPFIDMFHSVMLSILSTCPLA